MSDIKYDLIASDGIVILSSVPYAKALYYSQYHRGSEIVEQLEDDYWKSVPN